MHATDIGVVYHDGTLTFVARTGATVSPLIYDSAVTDDAKALALLLKHAEPYWRQLPSLCIAGSGAHRLMNDLYGVTRELPASTFEWLVAPNGSTFKNAGSEAMARLKQALDDGAIILTANDAKALATELAAFELRAGEGRPRYTLPDEVARTLNRYPARAIALALVSSDPRPLSVALRYVTPSAHHKGSYGGHNPFGDAPCQGHDPLRTFGHEPF